MFDEYNFDRESPFEPGKPASPELFIGRQKTLTKILRNVKKATNGTTQHFFLTGQRRMGKTSIAKYVQKYVENNFNMLGVYISNKGNDSIEQLTSWIIEAIFNQLPHESMKDKVLTWFENHIESIDVKGTKLTFKPDKQLQISFKDNFQKFLTDIYYEEFSQKKGIFIIIDDINGLSESKEFVDWYKRLADTIAVTSNNKLPIYFLLAGYPEKFENLVQKEESFGSIFNYDNIDALTDTEVESFFIEIFKQENITISQEALNHMVTFSSGLPLMMQQIGDSVFWETNDNLITEDEAINGIINAANEIGIKQIRPVLNQIKSENYEPILEALVENNMRLFKRSQVKDLMKNTSENVIKNFLYKMVDLGIFESVDHKSKGQYKFSNTLYYTYFLIKSIKDERKH